MNGKIHDLIVGVSTLVELGCIIGLASIGLKRNNDCYKAEMELLDTKLKLGLTEIEKFDKDCEIEKLKKELENVKSMNEES